ncbi:MAG: EamA family transporter RarD [Tissierellia bacterium]|nr:EamA family transporter RarD [Tissierellia bacterium]
MRNNKALSLALLAQVIWGLLPIYWKILDFLPPYQILAQRMVWSVVSLHILLYFLKGPGYSKKLLVDKSHRRISFLGGIFVTANWFVYIWSVNSGHVLETSLGYYILPLLTGLFALFLGEKFNKNQWLAYGFAGVGVLISSFALGRFPWVALFLASTFAIYTYFKKQSPLDAIDSLYTETIFVAPLALIYLIYAEVTGSGISGNFPWTIWLLVSTTGVVTALPLLLFGYGARELPLNVVSFIQYMSPSFTFLLGIFVFKESFSVVRLLSFVFIWCGVAIFTLDQVKRRSKKSLT